MIYTTENWNQVRPGAVESMVREVLHSFVIHKLYHLALYVLNFSEEI